jgi:MoxR-like ATPase
MEMEKNQIDSCIARFKQEMQKVLIGQEELVAGLLTGLIGGGHILLEGVPGLAKTLAANTLARIVQSDFKRIQFTPDLLPADVTGTMVFKQQTGEFVVRFGPIFSHIILADEINRSPAKVQSALLEAMEERQVTIGETSHKLKEPFYVIATQNPIEQEGTYPLPEAQVDRFMLKLLIDYPDRQQEEEIVHRMGDGEVPRVEPVLEPKEIEEMKKYIETIHVDEALIGYMVELVGATRPGSDETSPFSKYIEYGASPRGSLALFRCAKIEALLSGRDYVLPEDIKKMAFPVLRHRIILSYEAEAEGLTTDDVLKMVLNTVKIP